MKVKKIAALLLSLCFANTLYADTITLFGASDLRFALDEVKEVFLKTNPNNKIETIYGSSGKGMQQIENGAPYHLFFSANEDFVEKLYKKGFVIEPSKLYAQGRVVLWSKNKNFNSEKGFENLKEPWVKKIAIANPSHAPYGEKAKQTLLSLKMYENLESKLVLGENISQTAQFIESGAADIGVIALSLALAPSISKGSNPDYFLIDSKLHKPLLQGYSITKYAKDSLLAREFYDFMGSSEAKEILKKYGFEIK
ncbi:molybdate ABC transporter substrate-binding protein [Sulfurimonas sp.]|uniref:molybdate ABC transporter substrate-binding protein n=1 Tax=Sulfurimonas sp. TaxID=2022749 RepID=UPI00286D887A|nr:molybdate ABC transporter substrate-binding protein [Sulfurimonas sp.]